MNVAEILAALSASLILVAPSVANGGTEGKNGIIKYAGASSDSTASPAAARPRRPADGGAELLSSKDYTLLCAGHLYVYVMLLSIL